MVKYIVFELTGKCNLECRYCYNSKYAAEEVREEELSYKKVIECLEQAKELGFEIVAFSGGEPFLRDDFTKIIKNSPLPFSILTNGEVIGKREIDKLKKTKNLRELRFSLDGFQSHNKVRVNGDYQRVLENIDYSYSKEIKTSINTMMTKYNSDELLDLYQMIKEKYNNVMWRLDVPIISGRCKYNKENIILKKEKFFKKVKKIIEKYLEEDPNFHIIISDMFKGSLPEKGFYGHSMTEHPCDYALGSATIRPNGDVSFCPSLDINFGNVKDSSLKNILNNEKFVEFNKISIKDVDDCKDCKYLNICGTGCRADAYELEGDLHAKDPSACSHFKDFEDEILPILSKELQEDFKSKLKQ